MSKLKELMTYGSIRTGKYIAAAMKNESKKTSGYFIAEDIDPIIRSLGTGEKVLLYTAEDKQLINELRG